MARPRANHRAGGVGVAPAQHQRLPRPQSCQRLAERTTLDHFAFTIDIADCETEQERDPDGHPARAAWQTGAEGARVSGLADLRITHYTDPGCPWAFSAEPFRRKLSWTYGEQLEWYDRMVVLADGPESYEKAGFTVERQSAAFARMGAEHGMPIDDRRRARMSGTADACRAVVAARLHAPEQAPGLLRALRVRHFGGELLDDADTIDAAASDAGLAPEELRTWMSESDVATELDRDARDARQPTAEALAMDARLADWEGGRRYTCPSYEITRKADGVTLTAPGFQPYAVYWALVANLVPQAEQRGVPDEVEAVLDWAGEPLATQEVAVVCEIDPAQARQLLSRVALERPVGQDGFWSLR